jgi:uncharacterized protein YneF (UPF0154 family)
MIDPIYVVEMLCIVLILLLLGLGGIAGGLLIATKATQKSTEGMLQISHQQKKAIEGIWYVSEQQHLTIQSVFSELQRQNKYIKKKEGVIVSGPLPETDPVLVPPPVKAERRKKERALVTTALSDPDSGHAITVTNLPVVQRESVRPI